MKTQKGNMTMLALISMVIVVTAGIFFWMFTRQVQAPEAPQSVAQAPTAVALTMESVRCGNSYQADIVKIEERDVVQRILDLKTASGACELNIVGDTTIGVAQKVDTTKTVYTVALYDKNNPQQSADPFNQSVELYQIDLANNSVSFVNQFDGSFIKIGNWK